MATTRPDPSKASKESASPTAEQDGRVAKQKAEAEGRRRPQTEKGLNQDG